MIRRVLPFVGESDPWFKVKVPEPAPDATMEQLRDFAALCGVVSLNLAGPNSGRLDDTVKRTLREYVFAYELEMELPE
jgi:hypothetical protein